MSAPANPDRPHVSARMESDLPHGQEEITMATSGTETKYKLELHFLRMLNACAFRSEQKHKFPGMTVVIDIKHKEVKFSGMPDNVTSAEFAMYDILNAMKGKSLPMSGSLISFINSTAMKKHLVKQFNIKEICAVFDYNMESKKLMVYALNDKDLNIAVETINGETDEQRLTADLTNRSAREKFVKLQTKLRSEHNGLISVTGDDACVIVSGATTQFDVALREVKSFLEDNTTSDTFVSLDVGVIDYMNTYMKDEVNNVPDVTVRMEMDGRCGFLVTGHGVNLQQAVEQLQTLAQAVVIDQCVVDKPGMSMFLDSSAGKESLKQIKSSHKVVIVEDGEASQQGAEGGTSMTRSCGLVETSVDLPGGASIEVVRGDLTKCQADAIVNAAGGQLKLCRGLAKAIADAGIV